MESLKPFCQADKIVLGRKTALTTNAFSFSLPRHSITAVIGRNGSGKTTLLKAVLGENTLCSGAIRLLEQTIPTAQLSALEISKMLSLVPQEHQYPGHFRAVDLIGFSSSTSNPKDILSEFGLSSLSQKYLSDMSSGERQKTFLASAIAKHTPILLLDEPTNHLDPWSTKEFWELLASKKAAHHILVSTHDFEFVDKHADYVLYLEKGNLEFAGKKTAFTSPM